MYHVCAWAWAHSRFFSYFFVFGLPEVEAVAKWVPRAAVQPNDFEFAISNAMPTHIDDDDGAVKFGSIDIVILVGFSAVKYIQSHADRMYA